MAAERVSPLPWVLRVGIVSAEKRTTTAHCQQIKHVACFRYAGEQHGGGGRER